MDPNELNKWRRQEPIIHQSTGNELDGNWKGEGRQTSETQKRKALEDGEE